MPGWNIHLEAGERLADKLKFSGKKRKMFLLGCILPDINNGYINQVGIRKSHGETHYEFDQRGLNGFYDDYKDEIEKREPVCLGYLFHLYTDWYFNSEFYGTIKNTSEIEDLTREEKLNIKHHDFWIYDMNFEHQIGINDEEELDEMTKKANKIRVVEVASSEIMEIEEILQSEILRAAVKDKEYVFYTKEKLDELLDNMVTSFEKEYLGG